MFSFEGFIPKLCQLAQELGDDERSINLRSAGLQVLSSMVWFMGEHCHVSVEFDNVVSVVLENYSSPKTHRDSEDSCSKGVDEVQGNDFHVTHEEDVMKVPSWREIVNEKGELTITVDDAQNPGFWSRVCLQNMAKLAGEVTTMRHILESLFRYFDGGNLWSMQQSLAFRVLSDLQLLMDNSGISMHFLLSMLIKHLDNKNVIKQPNMQLDILEVTTCLAQHVKIMHSVAMIGAITDLMRHLRKSIHCSLGDPHAGADAVTTNKNIGEAVYKCLVQLSHKVGDAGPIFDAMAMMLENNSNVTATARTTVAAVYRTAQIVASMPNPSCQNKAFPEALFHQLLIAMIHPDHETRVGAHRIFSVVLVPSSVCPRRSSVNADSKRGMALSRSLSRSVSVFSSSAALFEKLKEGVSLVENIDRINEDTGGTEDESGNINGGMLSRLKSSHSRACSIPIVPTSVDGSTESLLSTRLDVGALRLSSHQISLLLSSIWAQSISPANTPENYEAIAHTYSLVLLFSRAKNSSHEALIRSLQMALSLRDISLMEFGPIPASRRRSLYMLSTSMILFSAKAFNITPLINYTKEALTGITVDPFLHLIEDGKLQAVKPENKPMVVYGSREDDTLAVNTLSEIVNSKEQTRGTLVSKIVESLEKMSNSELARMQEQVLSEFVPDEVCPLGTQFLDDPQEISRDDIENNTSHKEESSLIWIEDDTFGAGADSYKTNNPEKSTEIIQLLSVNQLLESMVERKYQVGRMSVSATTDVPYREMTHHCEVLLMGKQQKMSHLMVAQLRQESFKNFSLQLQDEDLKNTNFESPTAPGHFTMVTNPFLDQDGTNPSPKSTTASMQMQQLFFTDYQIHTQSFTLPASSPYDHFLKAAGC